MAETEGQVATLLSGLSREDRTAIQIAANYAISVATRIEEVRNELEKMVGDLRDEMATRFNALADEVDNLKGDKQPQDEKELLDPVILGIAQAYRMIGNNRLVANPVSYHLRQAYREHVNEDIEVGIADQSLMSYGLDADA